MVDNRGVFEDFREKHFTFSPPCTSSVEIDAAVSRYDMLVAGSDQVWHFSHPSVFFLEWGHPYEGRRVSYAPCCGHVEQPQGREEKIKK